MLAKEKFLKELSLYLRTLSEEEQKKIIFQYIQKYQIEMGKGNDSYSIVESWGTPIEAAEKIINDYHYSNKALEESEEYSLFKGIKQVTKFLYMKRNFK